MINYVSTYSCSDGLVEYPDSAVRLVVVRCYERVLDFYDSVNVGEELACELFSIFRCAIRRWAESASLNCHFCDDLRCKFNLLQNTVSVDFNLGNSLLKNAGQ